MDRIVTTEQPPASPTPAPVTQRLRRCAPAGLLFVVAFVLRLGFVLRVPGGLGGNVNDDSAAYYAGAAAIVHGRLPYADFVLLHPPLPDLLLTPFAALGAAIGDHRGFMIAVVFAELVGAANAVLVVRVARRYGIGPFGSLLGGLFYAVWSGAAAGESVITLESFGNTAFFIALLILAGPSTRRSALVGGAALGATVTTKIVWVVPVVIVAAWCLARRSKRARLPWLAAGIVGAPAVICVVFFAAAPRAMVRMVVVDQVNPPPLGSAAHHAALLSGVPFVAPGWSTPSRVVAYVCLVAVVVAVLLAAWRCRPCRMIVVIAVAQVAVLVYSPSYYGHYAVYLAPALGLSVAGAAATATRPWGLASRGAAVALVAFALAVTTVRLTDARVPGAPFPRLAVARLIEHTRCPTPDAPIVLIETDMLSRTLADGCPNWIDVTGRVYDVDRPNAAAGYSRRHNKRWQRSLNRYLFSGDVVILMRPKLGVGVRLQRRLAGLPLLYDANGVKIWRVVGRP